MRVRRALLAVGVAVAVLLVGFGVVVRLGAQPVVSGPLSRSLEPWIVLPGQPLQVALAVDARPLPSCPPRLNPLDVVLVIDRSSSMAEGAALSRAAEAALAFAEALPGGRTGIVAFNEQSIRVSPLGATASQIRADLAQLSPEDGTYIASGLHEAQLILESAPAQPRAATLQRIVILLSDGGAGDAEATLAAADALKQRNVRIITVALPGADLNPDLLRAVATTPDDAYRVSSLPDLPKLYRELAGSISSAAATDLKTDQPYSANRFDLDDDSVAPPADHAQPGRLLWRQSSLSAAGATYRYTLRPRTIGWHDVAGANGETTMIDCLGVLTTVPTLLGPKVFVSPLPAWLWPLVPFLFVVPLFLFNRKPKEPTAGGVRGSGLPDPGIDYSEKPANHGWVLDQRALQPFGTGASEVKQPDVLIIGIGRSGRRILGRLRQLAADEHGGLLPNEMRLLNIDVNLASVQQASAVPGSDLGPLRAEETLTLTPDLVKVSERLRSQDAAWNHLRWWGDHSPEDPGRAGSRMALFYDLLQGEERSLVWTALRKRLDGLRNPLIYVVGSLADPLESGMALDLPHFVRQMADSIGTGARRVVTLFLLQRSGTLAPERSEGGRNVYASLRELRRIMLREAYAYSYNPYLRGDKLVGSTDTTPIDACYLVDGVGESVDLSALPEDSGLYVVIADALLTLLSANVAPWHQDYVNSLPQTARTSEEQTGLPTVSSLNCATVAFPLAAMKRIAHHRFLLDLLFGGLDGKAPIGIARLTPGSERRVLDARGGLEGLEPQQRALMFLREGGQNNHSSLMPVVAQLAQDGAPIDEPQLLRLRPEDTRVDNVFLWALRDELLLILNGRGGDAVANRAAKLGGAIAFLSALEKLLSDIEASLTRRTLHLTSTSRQALAARISQWRRAAANSLQEARLWEGALLGSSSADERPKGRRQLVGSEATSLYDGLAQRLRAAQAEIDPSAQGPLHRLLDADEKGQEEVYQRHLGPDQLKLTGTALRPLELAAARLGWYADAQTDRSSVQLRVIVIPPNVTGSAEMLPTRSYSAAQWRDLLAALDQLAGHYTPLLDRERLADHLTSRLVPDVVAHLLKAQAPLAQYDSMTAADLRAATSSHLVLAVTDDKLREQIEHEIEADLTVAAPVKALANDDPLRCVLIGLTDVIQADGLSAVADAKADYTSDALAHVLLPEQRAASLEREWRSRKGNDYHFHPRFVRLLENDALVRLLALADLYCLLKVNRAGAEQEALIDLSAVNQGELKLAKGPQLTKFDIFYGAYQQWLKAPGEQPLSRARWPETARTIEKALDEERGRLVDAYAFAEAKRDEIAERVEAETQLRGRKDSRELRRAWERDVDVYLLLQAEQEKRAASNLG